jgi:hypothetical protein
MKDQDKPVEQDIDARLQAESARLLAQMDALMQRGRTIVESQPPRRFRVAVLKDALARKK